MTQIETRDTIPINEAFDRLENKRNAIRLGTDWGAVFVWQDPSTSYDDVGGAEYHVNVHVPVVEDRITIEDVDGGTISEAIEGAGTARIVDIDETPWGDDQ